MKKAVVFYGSMRELEMGSKSWHLLGDDVDYFLVTWDCVNRQHYDKNPVRYYPFDPSNFPVKVKDSIIVNFKNYVTYLGKLRLPKFSAFYILYHWSLIKNLANIASYETIMITRTDACFFPRGDEKYVHDAVPGKISINGILEKQSMNDWFLYSDAEGLNTLEDLYSYALKENSILNNRNDIHRFLFDMIQTNPNKFVTNQLFPLMRLIRPNYSENLLQLEYGPKFNYEVIRHSFEYEVINQTPAHRDFKLDLETLINDYFRSTLTNDQQIMDYTRPFTISQ